MNGFEIFSTLIIFMVIRFVIPLVVVVSVGNLLQKARPA